MLEYRIAALIPDWKSVRNDAVPGQPPRVYATGDLHLLKHPQDHVGLGHPDQGGIQATVASVLYVIQSETGQRPFFFSTPELPPLLVADKVFPVLPHIPN